MSVLKGFNKVTYLKLDVNFADSLFIRTFWSIYFVGFTFDPSANSTTSFVVFLYVHYKRNKTSFYDFPQHGCRKSLNLKTPHISEAFIEKLIRRF